MSHLAAFGTGVAKAGGMRRLPLPFVVLVFACSDPAPKIGEAESSTEDRAIRFVDRTGARITVDQKMSYGVAIGDVDGDGDRDLFYANFGVTVGNRAQRNQLFLNRHAELGVAIFDQAPANALPGGDAKASRKAVMGDIDGDGDLDIVVANSTLDVQAPALNQLLINDGRGRFTDRTDRLPAGARGGLTCGVALFDMDGDGDLDIFFGQYGRDFIGEPNNLIENRGNLQFVNRTDWLPADALSTVDVVAVDYDRDGDLDLVTAEVGIRHANQLYVNDGRGHFAAQPDALGGTVAASHSVTAAQINGDSYIDLVFGNLDTADEILLGSAERRFRRGSFGDLPQLPGPTTDIAVADVDRDGDFDFFVAKGDSHQDHLLLNDGRGRFSTTDRDQGRISYLRGQSRDANTYRRIERNVIGRVTGNGGVRHDTYTHQVELVDLDRDGHPEAVTAMGQTDVGETSRIFGNHQSTSDGRWGWFAFNHDTAVFRTSHAVVYYGMSVADLDRDGDLDAVVSGRDSRIMINRNGSLEDLRTDWIGGRSFLGGEAIRLGDFDGDGYPDAVSGGWAPSPSNYPNKIWRNDRGRRLVQLDNQLPAPGTNNNTDNFAVADVDGDGDLDILECNIALPWNNNDPMAQRNRLLINQGDGRFVDRTEWLPRDSDGDSTYAASFGDLDGDGDLDLVYANNTRHVVNGNRPGTNRVLINQGDGRFRSLFGAFGSQANGDSEDVALADLDGDGDLDVVFANYADSKNEPSRIFFNDGSGRFSWESGRYPLSAERRPYQHKEVEVGDIDRDGDIDIVLADFERQPILYLVNDGRGRFAEAANPDARFFAYAGDIELLDVDGDGDLDLYVGASDYKISRLLINVTDTGDGGGGDGGGGNTGPISREHAETFVMHAYRAILGRDAEPTGLDNWASRLESGAQSVLGLCNALANSREFTRRRGTLTPNQLTTSLYSGVLERAPTSAERDATRRRIVNGALGEAAADLLEGAEFADRFLGGGGPPPPPPPPPPPSDLSDAEIMIAHAYRGILGREAMPEARAGWASQIDNGVSVTEVCRQFFASNEFMVRRGHLTPPELADALYEGILERPADGPGRASAIAGIESGQQHVVAANMLESHEFRVRFLD